MIWFINYHLLVFINTKLWLDISKVLGFTYLILKLLSYMLFIIKFTFSFVSFICSYFQFTISCFVWWTTYSLKIQLFLKVEELFVWILSTCWNKLMYSGVLHDGKLESKSIILQGTICGRFNQIKVVKILKLWYQTINHSKRITLNHLLARTFALSR